MGEHRAYDPVAHVEALRNAPPEAKWGALLADGSVATYRHQSLGGTEWRYRLFDRPSRAMRIHGAVQPVVMRINRHGFGENYAAR